MRWMLVVLVFLWGCGSGGASPTISHADKAVPPPPIEVIVDTTYCPFPIIGGDMDSSRVISTTSTEHAWILVRKWNSTPYDSVPDMYGRFIYPTVWMDSLKNWLGPDCHATWVLLCGYFPHEPEYCQ